MSTGDASNDKVSSKISGGLFNGKNMFDAKAASSTDAVVPSSSRSYSSTGIFVASNAATNTVMSSQSHNLSKKSSNNIFSSNSGFNISKIGKSSHVREFTFDKENGKPANNGKRRRIVRGKRTLR